MGVLFKKQRNLVRVWPTGTLGEEVQSHPGRECRQLCSPLAPPYRGGGSKEKRLNAQNQQMHHTEARGRPEARPGSCWKMKC